VAVRLTLANGSQYPEVGKIDFTDVKVDQNTDTLMVRAVFANPDRTLTDGQYARVTAERKAPVEALVIPQRAILTDQSGNYVLVVGEGNRVAAKHVTTGANQGADVVVQQGLNDGDVVIVDGVQKVRPGQEVNPAPTSEPSVPAGGGTAPAGGGSGQGGSEQGGSGQAAPAKPAGN
jgi:membrane fusion protein (multidrug efflux system)